MYYQIIIIIIMIISDIIIYINMIEVGWGLKYIKSVDLC